MKFPGHQAQEHVEALAADADIVIHWISHRYWEAAWAQPSLRVPAIWVAKPTTMRKYLVALHELGHVLHPGARAAAQDWTERWQKTYKKVKHDDWLLASEVWAWRWALDNIHPDLKPWLNEAAAKYTAALLHSHLPWPGRSVRAMERARRKAVSTA